MDGRSDNGVFLLWLRSMISDMNSSSTRVLAENRILESSLLKPQICSIVFVRVVSSTPSSNASACSPSLTLKKVCTISVNNLKASSFVLKQLRQLSFQDISLKVILSTTFGGHNISWREFAQESAKLFFPLKSCRRLNCSQNNPFL
jgi:hypothetical protein